MKDLEKQSPEIQAKIQTIINGEGQGDLSLVQLARELLKEAEETGNKLVEGFCCTFIAKYYYLHENDMGPFREYLYRAVALQQEADDKDGLSSSYNLMAVDAMNNGRYQEALQYLHQCLANVVTDTRFKAAALSNMGAIYTVLGDLDTGILFCQDSIAVSSRFPEFIARYNTFVTTCTLSICYAKKGDRENCRAALDRALAIRDANPGGDISSDPYIYCAQAWYAALCGDVAAEKEYAHQFYVMLQAYDVRVDFIEDVTALGKKLIHEGHLELLPEIIELMEEPARDCGIDNFSLMYLEMAILYYEAIGDNVTSQKYGREFFRVSLHKKQTDNELNLRGVELSNQLRELEKRQRSIELENARLQQQASTDTLTGLPNRALLNEVSDKTFTRAKNDGTTFGVEMLDIDFFKEFNDTYGHQAGDECIRNISAILKDLVSQPDYQGKIFAARYGGDEFMILYTGMNDTEVMNAAESIRRSVASLQIPHEKSGVSSYVTVSQGIRNGVPTGGNRLWDFGYVADQALYEVKRSRKGQVRMLHSA